MSQSTPKHSRGFASRTRNAHRAPIVAVALFAAALVGAVGGTAANASGLPGSGGYLGSAQTFSVLGGSSVTNTGAGTLLSGDLGVAPGTSLTGFGVGQVGGATHADDAQAQTAQSDLTSAYFSAASATPSNPTTNYATLTGLTLTPGVYAASSSMGLTGALVLDGNGDPNATWVFQAGSTLTTASASTVTVVDGNPCNVFWQVGSSASLGSGSAFVGTVMALTSISATTGATVSGRLLAQNGAVTLQNNRITASTCALTNAGGGVTPAPTPAPSASSTPSSPTTPAPTASPTPHASATPTTKPTPRVSATPKASPSPSASASGSSGSGSSGSGSARSGIGTSSGSGTGSGSTAGSGAVANSGGSASTATSAGRSGTASGAYGSLATTGADNSVTLGAGLAIVLFGLLVLAISLVARLQRRTRPTR